jgi:hypothetical protein
MLVIRFFKNSLNRPDSRFLSKGGGQYLCDYVQFSSVFKAQDSIGQGLDTSMYSCTQCKLETKFYNIFHLVIISKTNARGIWLGSTFLDIGEIMLWSRSW